MILIMSSAIQKNIYVNMAAEKAERDMWAGKI
jgi:hypothetical protein